MPYLKAMDIFVGICSCFSVISLLETVLIMKCQKFKDEPFDFEKDAHAQLHIPFKWVELGIKISFPIFFTFFVSLFSFVYI